MKLDDVHNAAITVDGNVNAGYVIVMRSGTAVIIICLGLLAAGIATAIMEPAHAADTIKSTGMAIAWVLGAYAGPLIGVAAFLWGDNSGTQKAPGTTTLRVEQTTEGATAAPLPSMGGAPS